MLNINSPLKSVGKISPKYHKVLEKLGLHTIRDFLFYFPFRYDDFRNIVPLEEKYIGGVVTVEGKILKTKNTRLFRRRMTLTEIIAEDQSNVPMKIIWFNQPFILDTLAQNLVVRFSGKLEREGKYFKMTNPAWEKSSRDATNTGRLVPIYPETSGITSKWIRWQMKILLPIARDMDDIIPKDILEKFHLGGVYPSLLQIHFPDSREKLVRAQKRFAFEEMFLIQLKALQTKKEWEGKNSSSIKFDEKLIKAFTNKLPFTLTDAQKKAAFEILKDLEKSRPMNRLLNGDVGSGKTVVAALATLQTLSSGYQAAIMAPTEVLARQHFLTFCRLFIDDGINIALLTNSYKLFCHCERLPAGEAGSEAISTDKNGIATVVTLPRNDILKKISNGKINLVIGTHALIQKDIRFKNLALVIIDEQHRFGVAQRAALQSETMSIDDGKKKSIPHLLTMTATPIPRTLAIAFFGSLDLSILDEMPKNRKPIITRIVAPNQRPKIYELIKQQIRSGPARNASPARHADASHAGWHSDAGRRQAFVILPLVEESAAESMADVKAATQECKRLAEEIFPELKLGLLHGRLKAKEKEEVMKKFADNTIDILVSTSVVEVGIDIPNATVLVIENAERFGLSQLHQFRGRVGRSVHQSYCFLYSESGGERLKIMETTNDGFKIAERDLELRGPGQFFGTIQSGLPDIAMENLTNIKLIKFSREEAAGILKTDPELKKHPLLADALQKFEEKIHLE